MRKKRVWRYYCEYCKKSNCSGGAIALHEKHCTMNPDRVCRMCALLNQMQTDMPKLLDLLPQPETTEDNAIEGFFSYSKGFLADAEKAVEKLREITDNCPACILSAIRQKGIAVPAIKGFDYKQEVLNFFQKLNDKQREEDERAAYYDIYGDVYGR